VFLFGDNLPDVSLSKQDTVAVLSLSGLSGA
jgi:hypothetical protein